MEAAESDRTDVRREISRRMVSLFKEYVGRGPRHAQTFVEQDLVVIVLADTLTKAEHSLADDDREALVREVRRSFQGAMREAAEGMVEELTGRRVRAFMSDHSIFPDYAIEAFVLEPTTPGEEDPPLDGP